LSEVCDIPSEQVIFDRLSIIFSCPFSYGFWVVGSLPVACWDFEVGDRAGVGWFEYVVESLACIAAFLSVDESLEDFRLVGVTGESGRCSLFVEEEGPVIGGFGHD
jgi:hypothetical protein